MKRHTTLRIWSIFSEADVAMLRTPALPVALAECALPEMQQRIDDMIATMYQAEGIGLAAPQIGVNQRIAVIAAEVAGRSAPLVLLNPTIEALGTEQESGEEGCLSIPKVYGMVPRAITVQLKACDRHGQPYTLQAKGLFARVLQHEVDHLNGVLFIDRATSYTKGEKLLP
jgi:peptide deformylase